MSDGYLTIEQAKQNAASDLPEKDVEGVFGGRVRVKALSAAQTARIRNEAMDLGGKKPTLDFVAMERLQFQYGVIDPSCSPDDVKALHIKSGPSFAKVIAAIDELSGTDKKSLEEAEAAFPESGGGEE